MHLSFTLYIQTACHKEDSGKKLLAWSRHTINWCIGKEGLVFFKAAPKEDATSLQKEYHP